MRKTTVILLLISSFSFAENSLFEKANKEYINYNYDLAISLYDSILNKGIESSEIYYNLGNCYYKTKDWKNAIWHYEKSLSLKKDKKTIKNIELTQLNIKDKIEPLPKIFYKRWWLKIVEIFNTKTWQTLTLISFWLLLLVKILELLKKRKIKYLSDLIIVLALFLILITYNSYQLKNEKKYAIIFAKKTLVNSAPSKGSPNLFSLHSGTKIEIIDKIDNWINIKIESGNTGWIEESKCKKL